MKNLTKLEKFLSAVGILIVIISITILTGAADSMIAAYYLN